MELPGAGTFLSTAVVFALCGHIRQQWGAGCWAEGKIQHCSQPCFSLRAHLDTSWLLRCGFEPFSPDRHAKISIFCSQELEVLGARYLLLVQSQRRGIVPGLTSGYSFGPFLLEMQVWTSAFFLPFITLLSWCLLPASPQFCQHTVKMLRQCQWLFKMQRDRND